MLVLVSFLVSAGNLWACDGCAFFSGVTPMDQQSVAGLYFRHRFHSGYLNLPAGATVVSKTQHDPNQHPDGTPLVYNEGDSENYTTVNLYLRWFASEKWKLEVNLPIRLNSMVISDYITRADGLGDAQLLASYRVLGNEKGDLSWRLDIGGGIKLPTGRPFKSLDNALAFGDIAPGTGTVDGMFRANYSIKKGNWGLFGQSGYTLNTTNQLGFRFGNFLNLGLNAFRIFEIYPAETRIMLFSGAYQESFSGRYYQGERITGTGGSTTYAGGGINVFVPRFAIKTSFYAPFAFNLKETQIKPQPMFSVDLGVSF